MEALPNLQEHVEPEPMCPEVNLALQQRLLAVQHNNIPMRLTKFEVVPAVDTSHQEDPL